MEQEIERVLKSVTRRDTAEGFRKACVAALRKSGWSVAGEIEVPDRGDGRRGRVDLCAERDGVVVGIELDRMTPRHKSALKLLCRSWIRVIAIREAGGERRDYEGVHVVYPPEAA